MRLLLSLSLLSNSVTIGGSKGFRDNVFGEGGGGTSPPLFGSLNGAHALWFHKKARLCRLGLPVSVYALISAPFRLSPNILYLLSLFSL
jgi:hypothetical protein